MTEKAFVQDYRIQSEGWGRAGNKGSMLFWDVLNAD